MIGVRRTPRGVAEGDGAGRVYFSCSCKKRYQKKHAKKGYANREGYALIYLDIARLFFFPKHTIRLYFNSRSALKEGGVRTRRADVGRRERLPCVKGSKAETT